jgi:hypothetical protein
VDIPIRVRTSQTFLEYRRKQAAHEQELFRAAPDLKLQNAFMGPSGPVLSDLMPSGGSVLFNQRLSEAGYQYRFVNSLYESGTIHGVSLLDDSVTNPSCLDDIPPLEPRKNVNLATDYCLFFQESTINFGKTNVTLWDSL